MKKSMNSLSFPDVNLWLALAVPEHVHFGLAVQWWEGTEDRIAFCRLTQMGLLRLLTTASIMGGKPLASAAAWTVYDRFFADDRVVFVAEPSRVEAHFRECTTFASAAPKVWADAWLLAFAQAASGTLMTFDKALAARGAHCLLPIQG
jgi:toxin-antitoxin system PIN domain toxin